MDYIIGITLALLALLVTLVAFVWIGDHHRAIKAASPGWRALFTLLWVVLTVAFAIHLAHEAAERFGYERPERDRVTCTNTYYYGADRKKTGETSACTSVRLHDR